MVHGRIAAHRQKPRSEISVAYRSRKSGRARKQQRFNVDRAACVSTALFNKLALKQDGTRKHASAFRARRALTKSENTRSSESRPSRAQRYPKLTMSRETHFGRGYPPQGERRRTSEHSRDDTTERPKAY